MGKTKEDIRDKIVDLHKWNGLQDHYQEAWWEGDNCWCNYSEMEGIQNNHQSALVWSSVQDLASWGKDDHEKSRGQPRTTREELVNDLKAAGTTITKQNIGNTLRREGLKSCSARKVPLLKKSRVQAHLKFANEHLNDSEKAWENVLWSDETKIGINSTRCVWSKRNADYHPKNTIPTVKHGGGNIMFGAVFLLRVQDNFTTLRGKWTVKSWMRTSEHWRWVMDGSSSMNKGVAQEEAHYGPGVA